MMEQLEVPAAATVPNVAVGRVLSDEVRASLEAVRVAQVAARLRARRQTMRTRLWVAAALAAGGLVAVAMGPRIAARRHARPQAATPTAAPLSVSPERTAPAITSPATAEPVVPPATVVAPAAVVAPVAQTKAADVAGLPVEGCDTQLIRKAPWRLSAQACARAFDLDPTNAALALAVAHAEHAHGSISEAGQWAKRALALDPKTAEAYLLIARADVAQGHRDEARTAYRSYLELAPRGWHRAEARAAIEAARTKASRDPAAKR